MQKFFRLKLLRKGFWLRPLALLAVLLIFSGSSLRAQPVPRPDHIVIVIEENRSYGKIKDYMKDEPGSFLRELVNRGASFENFFAWYHPSQPNYILLFSGNNQDVTNDDKPKSHFSATSLAGALTKAGRTFAGYSEDLPSIDFDNAQSGLYVRKHCPWTNFDDVEKLSSLPFTSFPKDAAGFEKLPTISFVIPNLKNDMHGTNLFELVFSEPLIKDGDDWLRANLKNYAEWAMAHNSLLIVTWDESHKQLTEPNETHPEKDQNRIATIIFGQVVEPHTLSKNRYTHLDLLRTLEAMYEIPPLGRSKDAKVINDIWRPQAFWKNH